MLLVQMINRRLRRLPGLTGTAGGLHTVSEPVVDWWQRRLPVLTYHAVDIERSGTDPLALPPDLIKAQFDALQDAGFTLLGLTEALQTPGKVTAITFDDAYADALALLPMLAARGARATLYAPTAFLGGHAEWLRVRPAILSESELIDMGGSGIEIGSHGATHAPVDVLAGKELRDEIAGSRTRLQNLTGQDVQSFCYPHGYWNRLSRAQVAQAGYTNACVLGHAVHRRGQDSLTIKRLLVRRDYEPATLLRHMGAVLPSGRRVVTATLRVPWRLTRKVTERRWDLR